MLPTTRECFVHGPDGGTDLEIEGRKIDAKTTRSETLGLVSRPATPLRTKGILCQVHGRPFEPRVTLVGWTSPEFFYEHSRPYQDAGARELVRSDLHAMGDVLAAVKQHVAVWRCCGCGVLVTGPLGWCGAIACKQDPRWQMLGGAR
jgi:hypothetical protein